MFVSSHLDVHLTVDESECRGLRTEGIRYGAGENSQAASRADAVGVLLCQEGVPLCEMNNCRKTGGLTHNQGC